MQRCPGSGADPAARSGEEDACHAGSIRKFARLAKPARLAPCARRVKGRQSFQPTTGRDKVPGLYDGQGACWPSVAQVVEHASA
ncbi:MAG: hypothetical protein EOP58_15360, partial [Sphingomonadales bacterium]